MLKAVSCKAAFNNWLDLKVISATEGLVELHLPWRTEFGQYNGFLHASIVAGLIDTACGFAAATLSGPVLASQLAVRFLRPAIAELFALGAPDKLIAVGDALIVPIA